MKKIYLLAMGAILFGATTASAQTKEELKAQKEAQKAAEKLVKDAEKQYTMSIPNQQYGRKETNFEKLDVAKQTIESALANKLNSSNPNTYKVAAEIYNEYYKKLDNEVKTDDSKRPLYVDYASKVVVNNMKYDSLLDLDAKMKAQEKTFAHVQAQNGSVNQLLQCLQASQNYSNCENQDTLKMGYQLSSLVNDAFGSHLMSDFKNDNLNSWKLYAKAFRAQSLMHINGAKDEDVENAYKQLFGTEYEGVAYNSLINYYRDKNQDKYLQMLKDAYQNTNNENTAQFGFMYMQNLYTMGKKDECVKVIDDLVTKYPENDNTLNAYLMKGQIMFENKDYDNAGKMFDEVVAKYPDDDRAITMPAKCKWMKAQATGTKADREAAIKAFKDLEAKYPKSPDYWGEALYILYNNNNQPALRDKYKKYYKG